MNRAERRARNAANKRLPRTLIESPREDWPANQWHPNRVAVWYSRDYLVQVFDEPGAIRISVNRAQLEARGWASHIEWDELQEIKRAVGYGDRWAYECYPADAELVNVSNMRHLFLPAEPASFGWRAAL